MKYYIPPKPNETDDEFWARMAKMAEGAQERDVAEARCQRIVTSATPGTCARPPPALVQHFH
jgi:hypothetical protein